MSDLISPISRPLTAVLADDEPLPRLHLRMMLEQQGVTVIGEGEDVPTTLKQMEVATPDIVFLDIQMPMLNGIQLAKVLRTSEKPPLLVFVTGYSEYAVEAFDQEVFDYLLKPVSSERLLRTLTRARQHLTSKNPVLPTSEAPALAPPPAATAPLRRIPVRTNYAVRFIRVDTIHFIEARQKAVYLHLQKADGESTNDEGQRINYSLAQLEAMLPTEFVRIHDSYIAPLHHIEELVFLGNHSYAVRLTGGQTLPVGRSRYPILRECLGLDPARDS